jgi:N-acetylglucosaminyl-diphospho-decaprenol L-rhamnosyltransferase
MLDETAADISSKASQALTQQATAILDATSQLDLTVVVVNFNTAHLLDRMISTLSAAQGRLRVQLIIIDNASHDPSVSLLRSRYPDVDLIVNDKNVGFGRANNQALSRIRGKFVLLLNTDAFVSKDTLSKTIDFMAANANCGILGVKLVGEDGTLQPSCRFFPTPWNEFLVSTGLQKIFSGARLVDDMSWDHSSVRECDWVPGCYYLMRRELVDQIGLFDSRYFLYFEEVDHCKAARNAGWSVMFYPFTTVVHIGGESAKSQGSITRPGRQISGLEIESKLLFFRKHYGLRGIFTMLILSTAKLVLSAVKDIARPRDNQRSGAELAELRTTLKTLRATRFASAPTR